MKLSEVFKSQPKEKAPIDAFCGACHKLIVGRHMHVQADKTVIVEMKDGQKPVPVQIALNVCATCYAEWLYEMTQAYREVMRA